MIGKLEEVTLVEAIRRKRFPTEKCQKGRAAAAAAKSLQSCLTLCDPIDGSPPGSLVPGILQARTLEWVAISFSNEEQRGRAKNNKTQQYHIHKQQQPPTNREELGEPKGDWVSWEWCFVGWWGIKPQHTCLPPTRETVSGLWGLSLLQWDQQAHAKVSTILWAPGCWPAVGGCLRQSHTHHHSGTHSTPGTVSASSSIRQSLMK